MTSTPDLDLSVTLTPPPVGAPPDVLASITLRCNALGLSHHGDLLTNPLSTQERQDLQWYLEEYWQWPYEGFLSRGKQIEALLPEIGKRLYESLFGSKEADRIVQKWLSQPETAGTFQLSIISELPAALSLPWELLHSEQGYLALRGRRPISIVRRLPQSELTSDQTTTFTPPMRILLVTARPEGTGFVDPRSIARELLDEVQEAIDAGTIAVEFLRPPTLSALQERLRDTKRPAIHILHFDGHGIFGNGRPEQEANPHLLQGGGLGMLAFETEEGTLDLVKAEDLAQTLQDSQVQLAVLTACQSAMGSAEDVFSGVAARLIRGGVKAVSAMSASVLVVSAARYTEAFYKELAGGARASLAQERARQSLYTNPQRHTVSRYLSEEGAPVVLRDWWLPHFYQQVPLLLQPMGKKKRARNKETRPVLNAAMPSAPRYGFSGRSRELLQLERSLGQHKLVVIHGFGGMGKTTLAREAADWLTRTGMYQGACFVSFDGGRGTATSLLSQLGFFLSVYDGTYTPDDPKKALDQLQAVLKRRRILLIADNLESILPGGEAELSAQEQTELWNVLLDLQRLGAGVLLTTRTTAFGDERLAEEAQVVYLPLAGLGPDDAYQLASSLLTSLRIDRRRTPYQQLRELLRQLDHHPLSIQLVLPALRTYSLAQIQQDLAALLPKFIDDAETGHNRSLLTSLEYSLRRLSERQRGLLSRLSVFEGGAMENCLIEITEIAETDWSELRKALEQAALLTVERLDGVNFPFLHFHPILIPFLRGEAEVQGEDLKPRYAQWYFQASNYYYDEDSRHPIQIRAIVQRELPNLRHAFEWLLECDLDQAVNMANNIGRFLDSFGLHQEQQRMYQHVAEALASRKQSDAGALTQTEYMHESTLGENEQQKRQLQAAITRFGALLARIEAQSESVPLGLGSYAHAVTLARLGRCFEAGGDLSPAESLYRRAISISEALLMQKPENHSRLHLQSSLLADLGNVLLQQGHYAQAKVVYEQGLHIDEILEDVRGQAISRGQLGAIALEQRKYAEAQQRYQEATATFQVLGEPAMEAVAWHQLGRIAQELQSWSEAEQCYRQSLVLKERLGDLAGAAQACSQLGQVADATGRFEEAKGWLQHALVLSERIDATSGEYASYLFNMANLLVQEAEAGRAKDISAQLAEAQSYVEQATTINERLESPDLWMNFHLLARIANLQGHVETVRNYRRREREAYAAFAGHRFQIDRQFGSLLPAFAAAQYRPEVRAQIEDLLPQLEAKGWHISQTLQRIWTGERDWHVLSEGLDDQDALLVLRVLEVLTQPEGMPEQIVAALLPAIHDAIEQDNQEELVQQLLYSRSQLSKKNTYTTPSVEIGVR
jgi:tetratricopeptide (TPR) repeat protein